MLKIYFLLSLLLTSYLVLAQQEHSFIGQVMLEGEPLAGLQVINRNNRAVTHTAQDGTFRIAAKANDVVVVFDDKQRLEALMHTIPPTELFGSTIVLQVKEAITQLDEMVIDNLVTTKSLGLANLKVEPLHPTSFDFVALAMALFSKRNKTPAVRPRPRYLKIEDKKFEISSRITDSELQQRFNIAAEDIGRFYYFLIEDATFMQTITQGNQQVFEIELIQKVSDFKALQAQK